jgi:uncharacterized protein (TIGR03437 family)
MTRTRWLCIVALVLAPGTGFPIQAQTGTAVPSLAPYDAFVTGLLSKYNIPGASLAITLNGRLVFARGYGYADAQKTIPVQPDSLFRIASLSKAITAVTVLKLVEQGKLTLDAPAFALLPELQAPPGTTPDARLKNITIRNLLNHTGGWDRDKTPGGYDPMFIPTRVVSALGVQSPPSTENIIRYMLGQPLDFTPGTKYVYSNFGYAVLGRIIERITQTSYEIWVRDNILAPAGITGIRIGQSLPQGQMTGEVKYVGGGGATSIFPDFPSPVEWAYGGWYLEAMDSHGAWVSSAIDYAKFLNAIDGRRGNRLLSPASVAALTARPAIPEYQGTDAWYAMGLQVNTSNNWWHSGGLDGTATYQIRTSDGFVYVLFLNSQGQGTGDLYGDMDSGYWNARGMVTSWPAADQFTSFPDADPKVTAVTPVIRGREGVLNGATFDRGVVSGSWFSIFGENLSATTRIWASADIVGGVLPQSLDGVSVKVDGKPAFVYYISPGQINAQAPAGLGPGWRRVEVTRNGAVSGGAMTHTVLNAPGAIMYSLGGRTFAVATNLTNVVLGDPALAPGVATCAPGETVVIYSMGLAVSPAGTATPSLPPLNVQVTIGGRAATVSFAGLISPGLFQINAVVPAVPNGDQELLITSGGVKSPGGVVLFVQK